MALPFAFQSLVQAFASETVTNVTFLRSQGNAQVIAGTAIVNGFAALTLSPNFVCVPRVPKDLQQYLPAGDRHRSGCLVWSIASDFFTGATYDVLQTVRTPDEVVDPRRSDRIVDNDRGITYIVSTDWAYGRQSGISGAIGLRFEG